MPNNEKMLDKVRGLLAKAESSDSAHEAEALTAKATELMIKYAIDEAMLQKAGDKVSESIVIRHFSVSGYAKAKIHLLNALAVAMDVRLVMQAKPKSEGWSTATAEAVGWESDLASLDVLFASLLMQVENDANRAIKNNTGHGRSFRQAFILGFAREVGSRLAIQRARTIAKVDESTPGAALAVVERSVAVQQNADRRWGKTGKGTASRVSSGDGYASGKASGARANIGQTTISGGRKALSV